MARFRKFNHSAHSRLDYARGKKHNVVVHKEGAMTLVGIPRPKAQPPAGRRVVGTLALGFIRKIHDVGKIWVWRKVHGIYG